MIHLRTRIPGTHSSALFNPCFLIELNSSLVTPTNALFIYTGTELHCCYMFRLHSQITPRKYFSRPLTRNSLYIMQGQEPLEIENKLDICVQRTNYKIGTYNFLTIR